MLRRCLWNIHTKWEFSTCYTRLIHCLPKILQPYFRWYLYQNTAGLDQIWIISDLWIYFLTFKTRELCLLGMQIDKHDLLSSSLLLLFTSKVTPTEETIRQNSIDSILHEKNHFCFGWIEKLRQSHKFSTSYSKF